MARGVDDAEVKGTFLIFASGGLSEAAMLQEMRNVPIFTKRRADTSRARGTARRAS